MEQTDRAYPWVAQLLPSGVKGLVFAALSAAIVSSLASMLNSTATIFTMDIFREYVKKDTADKTLVTVAWFIAPQLSSLGQAFQYIQEYTGLVSPGILAVFVSLSSNPADVDPKAIRTTAETFKTSQAFAVASYAVLLIIAVIYAAFWDADSGFAF